MEEASIICSTLAFSGSGVFTKMARKFDAIVIDEAAQAVEPSVLVALTQGAPQVYLVRIYFILFFCVSLFLGVSGIENCSCTYCRKRESDEKLYLKLNATLRPQLFYLINSIHSQIQYPPPLKPNYKITMKTSKKGRRPEPAARHRDQSPRHFLRLRHLPFRSAAGRGVPGAAAHDAVQVGGRGEDWTRREIGFKKRKRKIVGAMSLDKSVNRSPFFQSSPLQSFLFFVHTLNWLKNKSKQFIQNPSQPPWFRQDEPDDP